MSSEHAPYCDGLRVYDLHGAPEPGYERYIGECDGTCMKVKPEKCPKCGGPTVADFFDYPPMPGVDWRCASSSWACSTIESLQDDRDRLRDALQILYDFLPRYSCKSDKPDGCAVCVARAALKDSNG